MNAYKYLYYRIYSWNKRNWGEGDLPQFNALLGTAFLVSLNLYSFLIALNLISGLSVIELLGIDTFKLVIGMSAIAFVNYLLFLRKNEFRRIEERFRNESDTSRRTNFGFCVAYVVGSFLLLIFLSLISDKNIKFLVAAYI